MVFGKNSELSTNSPFFWIEYIKKTLKNWPAPSSFVKKWFWVPGSGVGGYEGDCAAGRIVAACEDRQEFAPQERVAVLLEPVESRLEKRWHAGPIFGRHAKS